MSVGNKEERAAVEEGTGPSRLEGGHQIEDTGDGGSGLWVPGTELFGGNYQDTNDSLAPHKTNVIETKTAGHMRWWSFGVERVRK